jgi:hypothetical protein
MGDNQEACAHRRVSYKRIENSNGTFSDSWRCDSGCGAYFWPGLAPLATTLHPAAPPAGKPGEPDFGTHEEVIAGLDAINEHNRAEIAINQAFYDIVPLIFGTVEGGADKVREILRGLRNSSHSEAICAAAEVVDKFRGWQNEEFEANLIERILSLAPSLAQPDGTKSGPT